MKGLSGDSESGSGYHSTSRGEDESRTCDACGARARREAARFCATCGRALGGGYFPTDSLRASYRFERVPADEGRARAARAHRRGFSRGREARVRKEFMAVRSESRAAALAMAFVTYALVPYLGILFCPGALLFGSLGLVRAWREPRPDHARASLLSLVLCLAVLCVQLLLWWILYRVPEWARQSPF